VARSSAEAVLQVAACGAWVALLAEVVRVWPRLPAAVPTHFGVAGSPDAWGSRASLLALPALATAFFVVLSALERVPHVYNYPIDVTADNAPRVYSLARRMVLCLKLILVVALGLVFHISAEVALGRASALPVWFLPAVLAATAGIILVTVVSMKRTVAPAGG
jgi:uncharacterized membrane protein